MNTIMKCNLFAQSSIFYTKNWANMLNY